MKIHLFILMLLAFSHIKAMEDKSPIPARAIEFTELEKIFFEATHKENTELFSRCLKRGVNCNAVHEAGYTALQNICISGRYLLISLILNANDINVDQIDQEGQTALHYAAWHGADETPKLHALLMASLIQKGANINARSKNQETPLSILLKTFGQPTILSELLIDHGADINLTLVAPSPLNPIITETIFEQAIRSNNPERLLAFLKSAKGITKPVILKALTLTRFGYNKPQWGRTLWPKTSDTNFEDKKLKANFKKMEQMLRCYYFTMQGLGFYDTTAQEVDWHRNPKSKQIPADLAKKIAWHAVKQAPFDSHEKKCLLILFGV